MEQRSDSQLRERIAVLETQINAIERHNSEIAKDVKSILATLSEARGGWKMMMLIGGSAGVVGAFIGKWMATIVAAIPK